MQKENAAPTTNKSCR